MFVISITSCHQNIFSIERTKCLLAKNYTQLLKFFLLERGWYRDMPRDKDGKKGLSKKFSEFQTLNQNLILCNNHQTSFYTTYLLETSSKHSQGVKWGRITLRALLFSSFSMSFHLGPHHCHPSTSLNPSHLCLFITWRITPLPLRPPRLMPRFQCWLFVVSSSCASTPIQYKEREIQQSLCLVLFFIPALLRYNSYTIQFTHLKCIVQWFFSIFGVVQPSR